MNVIYESNTRLCPTITFNECLITMQLKNKECSRYKGIYTYPSRILIAIKGSIRTYLLIPTEANVCQTLLTSRLYTNYKG